LRRNHFQKRLAEVFQLARADAVDAGHYLIINIQKYGALQIARRGRGVAAGEEDFALREIDTRKPARSAKPRKAEKLALAEGDRDLLAALKKLRLELARMRGGLRPPPVRGGTRHSRTRREGSGQRLGSWGQSIRAAVGRHTRCGFPLLRV